MERTYSIGNSTLPGTLYYQINGGFENTANIVILMKELLVAKGLTKKIVITRLPSGHTHEDIGKLFEPMVVG